MAGAGAAEASGVGCSEPAGRLECAFVDPVRDATFRIALSMKDGRFPTLSDALAAVRAEEVATPGDDGRGPSVEGRRFVDGLFQLSDDGTPGDLIPGLRFLVGGRIWEPDRRLEHANGADAVRIEIDRTRTGYSRNWPAYLTRRWRLRAASYTRFVESAIEAACGREAGTILRLDSPDRVRRFLAAVARWIYDAPYETYSRYLEPFTPFKSCDQTLDRILAGDGGNCAEKAMALYFIAHAYGISSDLVLGGEEASGKFPHRALRSILDDRTFAAEATRDAQRHWQHYAVLCRPSDDPRDDVFCDVAGSNIPFLFLGSSEAATYLGPGPRRSLPVVITLEPIPIFYHRLAGLQALPLDLYYAMEHYIESLDVVHTIDNELGLLHAGEFWVGAVAFRGRRDFRRIVREYESFVARAGLDPRCHLAFATDPASDRQPILERFRALHPREADLIQMAHPRLRQRIAAANRGPQVSYVVLRIPGTPRAASN